MTKLFIRASFDGGSHWRTPLQVDDSSGEGEALQPGIAVAPNGRVAVAFYDRRLPCPARDTPEASIAGLPFDPRVPYGRANYCINAAIQFYKPSLAPIGHNIRLSQHGWDPQLSALHPGCLCSPGTFIGDYFGIVSSSGGDTFVTSVSTFTLRRICSLTKRSTSLISSSVIG